MSEQQNAQIHAQLGRKYEAGFITDIESDSLPPGLSEDIVRALSAIKDSEDGEWLVVRSVNQGDDEAPGRLTFGFPIAEARLARLDETPLYDVPVENAAVEFTAGPRAVTTILVR
jgi:hypothetical protein